MAHYRKPGKLNLVSVLIFLVLASLVYGAIFFGPAYWRKFQVSEVLDEAASKCRRKNRVPNAEQMEQIRAEARQQILAKGVDDERVTVEIVIRSDHVTVSADYEEVIHHPLIKRTTTLRFRPEITRSRMSGF